MSFPVVVVVVVVSDPLRGDWSPARLSRAWQIDLRAPGKSIDLFLVRVDVPFSLLFSPCLRDTISRSRQQQSPTTAAVAIAVGRFVIHYLLRARSLLLLSSRAIWISSRFLAIPPRPFTRRYRRNVASARVEKARL